MEDVFRHDAVARPAAGPVSHPAAAAVQPCSRCGGDAPHDFGSVWLCLDCYHIAGSTCAGVGQPRSNPDPVC